MYSENLKHLTTLLANFAVFFGLVFLVLEMRQTSAIATAQVRMDYSAAWRNVDSARQDKEFAVLINKSFEQPEALSVAEVIQLDAYYWGVMDQMINAQTNAKADVRLTSFESMVSQNAPLYFTSAFSQSWWKQAKNAFDDPEDLEFYNVVDRAITAAYDPSGSNRYNKIKNDLTAELEAANPNP